MAVSIRPYVQGDLDIYRGLLDQVHNNPLGDELFQTFEQSLQQCTVFQRFMLESEGQALAVLEYYHMPWTSGDDTLQARLIVDRGHRRKGYGELLYQKFMNEIQSLSQFTSVRVVVRDSDDASYHWAKRRGFEIYAHQFESTLDLTSLTQERLDAELQKAKQAGITFQTLGNLTLDEPTIKRVYDFLVPMLMDTPDNTESAQVLPLTVFEMHLQTLNPNLVYLALRNGEWAGITTLTVENGRLYTVFTGMSREHRGNNLSYYLKLYSVQAAKNLGYSRMRTNNQSDNAPMLAINQKLGYVSEPGNYRLYKSNGS